MQLPNSEKIVATVHIVTIGKPDLAFLLTL